MTRFDERAELAPRDIVARAIDHEIKRLGLDYVHPRHLAPRPGVREGALPQHLRASCCGLGIDITARADPGGAGAALHLRRSPSSTSTAAPTRPAFTPPAKSPSPAFTAPTASPPTACSNASSSAKRRRGTSSPTSPTCRRCPRCRPWDESRVTDSDEEVVIAQTWGEIRRFMWNYVGIVRSNQAARAGQAPDRHAAARSPRLLRAFPGHSRPDRAAQPAGCRRPDRPLRPGAARKAAGCITRSIIPTCCRSRRTRFLFHNGTRVSGVAYVHVNSRDLNKN